MTGVVPLPQPHDEDGETSLEEAQRIVEALERQGVRDSSESDVRLVDVQDSIAEFRSQVRILTDLDTMPCLGGGSLDMLAVDLRPFGLRQAEGLTSPSEVRQLLDRVLKNLESFVQGAPGGIVVETWPTSMVEEAFKDRLVAFVATRLRSLSHPTDGDRDATVDPSGSGIPGVRFRVDTVSTGLRVYSSPSYFFTPSVVFGAPTSPVHGVIQPGRYVFGAGKLGASPQFDFSEYDVPPHTSASLAI
jgi:hypothetical protein